MDEQILWKGRTSHVQYLLTYTVMIIFTIFIIFKAHGYWRFLILIPSVWNCWNYFYIEFSSITITNQRIIFRHGIFNKYSEEIELFRIKDLSVFQPFLYRLRNCGNIVLISTDKTAREFTLKAVPDVERLKEMLRTGIIEQRKKFGVKEMDINF
jgi:uncharacterized membrane protein YdbT with pleckstrin-like domain